MKIVGILQPGYLPWLGFFEQMLRSDLFVIYDDVQYDKHGWRNRNRVKGPQGPVWLTVPVRLKGLNKPAINEVLIDPVQGRWAAKHCATLSQLYGKAPFFAEYYPRLEETLLQPWEKIVDLDLALIRLLAGWLGLTTEIVLSSSLGGDAEDPTARLVQICREVGADIFYEGSSGRNYLDLPSLRPPASRWSSRTTTVSPIPSFTATSSPTCRLLICSSIAARKARLTCPAWGPPPSLTPPLPAPSPDRKGKCSHGTDR